VTVRPTDRNGTGVGDPTARQDRAQKNRSLVVLSIHPPQSSLRFRYRRTARGLTRATTRISCQRTSPLTVQPFGYLANFQDAPDLLSVKWPPWKNTQGQRPHTLRTPARPGTQSIGAETGSIADTATARPSRPATGAALAARRLRTTDRDRDRVRNLDRPLRNRSPEHTPTETCSDRNRPGPKPARTEIRPDRDLLDHAIVSDALPARRPPRRPLCSRSAGCARPRVGRMQLPNCRPPVGGYAERTASTPVLRAPRKS
jgi:hypothetical protein